MDLRKLKTLIDLVAESGIAELEITEAEDKVRIVKFSPMVPPGMGVPALSPAPAATANSGVSTPPAPGSPVAPPPADGGVSGGYVVKSPMVGTFYRAPTPGAAPFVKPGDQVKAKDTLCIIEAMKLLNEIIADKDGVIEKILVEDAEPVEFGQSLFVIV